MINVDQKMKHGIDGFIRSVFEYYNGRINIFNKAVLEIEWAGLWESPNGGYSTLPNIVTINPLVIARYVDSEFEFGYRAVDTIIHELYHTDQIIMYNRMGIDPKYTMSIEGAVECEVINYMRIHVNDIGRLFGLCIDPASLIEVQKYVDDKYLPVSIGYHRRRYWDHLYMLINAYTGIEKCDDSYIYDMIKNICLNGGRICVIIDGRASLIKDYTFTASVEVINHIFYRSLGRFKYLRTDAHVEYTDTSLDIYININSKSNIMCTQRRMH